MSTDRDVSRIVRSWLNEDRHEDADRVLNSVLDQLDTTPQRRTLWSAWRFPIMNNVLRVGLAAAAVVIIAVIAINLLPGSPTPGGTVSPSPSAPAEPSSEPSSTPAGLPVGSSFVLSDGQPSGGEAPGSVAMTVTIPAPGWFGAPDDGILLKNDDADPPDGAGMIVWAGVDHLYVYGDPCGWSSTRPETPSTTVDEVVAALTAQASRDASAPVDITLDGYAGKAITLHVPDDADFTQCDEGFFGSWSQGTTDLSPQRYHQGPGQIDEVWILDVDGLLVVIDWDYYAGTPQADVDELRAIVESATFGQ
jgi:hypothetical protein